MGHEFSFINVQHRTMRKCLRVKIISLMNRWKFSLTPYNRHLTLKTFPFYSFNFPEKREHRKSLQKRRKKRNWRMTISRMRAGTIVKENENGMITKKNKGIIMRVNNQHVVKWNFKANLSFYSLLCFKLSHSQFLNCFKFVPYSLNR